MRKLTLLTLFTLIAAIPLQADTRGRAQSYISYDDGGTILRQGDDGRETESRVNLPIFAGDELVTNRRGRVEVRLSDGNVIGIDRSTDVRFKSMADDYDNNDATQTIVELRFGHMIVQRGDDNDRAALRIDTENASYFATDEAIYSIDDDGRGKDMVTVFDGSVEVRTPTRTSRVREGEQARVDDQGLYGLVNNAQSSADDFERWFLRRSETYSKANSRYLDRSIAYSDYDLESHGSWVYVSGYGGWCWRPVVSVGWRPYYNGYWVHGRSGALVWVSLDPWGWAPYHYGRWCYEANYGWMWLPGAAYSPAWVYWMYGSSYVGWAPAGWYDCYRPYYNWAYRPYQRAANFGFGFYGRVRVNEVDLRPWTFVDPNTLVSNRVDRAALTTDAVRQRLQRGGGDNGFATVSGAPARFNRNEIKDPSSAVNAIARRGIGSGTGNGGSGSSADMTSFFRRDPELSNTVRERIVRTAPPAQTAATPARSGYTGGGTVAPGAVNPGYGDGARIDRGGVIRRGGETPTAGSSPTPTAGDRGTIDRGSVDRGNVGGSVGGSAGSIDRGGAIDRGGVTRGDGTPAPSGSIDRSDRTFHRDRGDATSNEGTNNNNDGTTRQTPTWRERVDRITPPPSTAAVDRPTDNRPRDDGWRGKVMSRNNPDAGSGAATHDDGASTGAPVPSARTPVDRSGSDVPRRVIDGIGGARVYPADGGRSHDTARPRESAPAPRESAPRESAPRERESAPRESAPREQHSSPPPRQESPRSSGGESHSSGGNNGGGQSHSGGGNIHRDHHD